MASNRRAFTLIDDLAHRARALGIDISAAARDGAAAAGRSALARADRAADQRRPERPDPLWTESEAWSE